MQCHISLCWALTPTSATTICFLVYRSYWSYSAAASSSVSDILVTSHWDFSWWWLAMACDQFQPDLFQMSRLDDRFGMNMSMKFIMPKILLSPALPSICLDLCQHQPTCLPERLFLPLQTNIWTRPRSPSLDHISGFSVALVLVYHCDGLVWPP